MHKKYVYIFLLIIILFFIRDTRQTPVHGVNSYDFLSGEERMLLKNGDIILRKGFGMMSSMIAAGLNENYKVSHCGVLCKDTSCQSGWRVIHTVSASLSNFDGMQSVDLDTFLRNSAPGSVIVSRFRMKAWEGLPSDSITIFRNRIAHKAGIYLERKIPFDHGFEIDDSTGFYCSELIWHILQSEFNVNIFQKASVERYEHLNFSYFWDTKNFRIIINHHELNE